MKTHRILGIVLLGTLTAIGSAEAAGPLPDQSEEFAPSTSSLVIGRVTKVDGESLLVQEDGGDPVRVQVTPQTMAPRDLKVGDEVIVSRLANGAATIITRGEIQAEVSVLDESGRDSR